MSSFSQLSSNKINSNINNKQLFSKIFNVFGISWFIRSKILSSFGINLNSKLFLPKDIHFNNIFFYYLSGFFNIESQLKQIIYFSLRKYKNIRNYRGLRHLLHLSVNGQRTHTNCKTQRKLFR